jgi:hypothetical protein
LTPQVHRFYRHFKGGLYYVESISTHTETGEKLVNYVAAEDRFDAEAERWSRPISDHPKAWTKLQPNGELRFVEVD